MGREQDLTPDEPENGGEDGFFIFSEAKVTEEVSFFISDHVITFFSDGNYENIIGSIYYLDDSNHTTENSFNTYLTNTFISTTLLPDINYIYFTHTYNSSTLDKTEFKLDSDKIDDYNPGSSSSLILRTTNDPTIEPTDNGDIITTKYVIENMIGFWSVIAFTQTLIGY